MMDAGATWTDERVELLKKLWIDGLSASQIAAELGNVTRNAVIGKVHRLGLSGRAKDAKPAASDLRESMCRWPMGDPTKPEFRFCGARSITGLPYCTHHARIAYQPVADRKRERKLIRA